MGIRTFTSFIGILLLLFSIEFANSKEEPERKDILAEKILMQKADQLKRDGYYIDVQAFQVCAERLIPSDIGHDIERYCNGQAGKNRINMPDSLFLVHQKMIERVDKIAHRRFGVE